MAETASRLRPHLRTAGTAVVLCGLVAVVTVLGSLGGPRLERTTGTALVMLVLVVGLKVFIGDSGVFSFGHTAFMGVGAYTTAIVSMAPVQQSFQLPDLPAWLADVQLTGVPAALVSGLVATVVAGVISLPLMRLSGLTASLATVAVLIAFYSVFRNAETFTRGSAGLILGVRPPPVGELLVWACLAIVGALVLRHSRIGLRLAASREDEVAARALGIRVWWERGLAFTASAFVVGVAGSLFAQYFGSLNPNSFYLTIAFTAIAMLVVGGLTSVSGAVVGTLVVSAVLELLRRVEGGVTIGGWEVPSRPGMTEVGLALLLLVVLLLRPSGLTRGRELDPLRLLSRARRRRLPPPQPADDLPATTDAAPIPDASLR
ncbi:branched-chain amino acid ABC transporter permease [Blastococcus sp. SYSU D00669]